MSLLDIEAEAKPEAPTTAADIRAALYKRWPAGEYVVLEEVPDDASRLGRKLDMVAVSGWRSRGFELDGVEIKVSMSDWQRELNNAQKADWWWRHVDRFWLAVPQKMADKVRPALPPTWGLMSCSQTEARVIVQAPRHKAEPFSWQEVVGLLRCASGVSYGALNRAGQKGYSEGYERAKAQFEGTTGDARLRQQYADLKATLDAFEEASGLKLHVWADGTDGKDLGELVRFVQDYRRDPQVVASRLGRTASDLMVLSQRVAELSKFGEQLT